MSLMCRKRRHKSSQSFKDARSGMHNLLIHDAIWGFYDLWGSEILRQLLMFPLKFKARTGRLSRGGKEQLQPISLGNGNLNWKKDSVKPLQDQRAAAPTRNAMFLRAKAHPELLKD